MFSVYCGTLICINVKRVLKFVAYFNPRTADGLQKAAAPSFFSISLASWNCPVRFVVFLEPSKLDEMTLRLSKQSKQLSNDVTGSKGGVDDFLVKMW